MHETNRRRIKRQNAQRAADIAGLMIGQVAIPGQFFYCAPMPRPLAERVVAAERRGLDLWALAQGRPQFLTANQVHLAMNAGLSSWLETNINGADSADPFFTLRGGWSALRQYWPEILAVHTRCAGRDGDHSTWAYGPVFLSREAAKTAGHSHEAQCQCGYRAHPL